MHNFRTWLRLCAFVVVLVLPSVATAQTVVGIGANAFFEDSNLKGVQQISVQENDESYAYRSKGFLTGALWFLFEMSDRIRAGSMLDYYGTYSSATKCDRQERDCAEFEPDFYEFGKLLEFHGRFEYIVPTTENFDLILGAVFGVPILFPSGDFREEIDGLAEQGAAVFKVPRIGYLVGPNIAGRIRYNDHLFFRVDAILKWEQMFLFRTVQQIDGISFRKRWTTNTLRYELGVGLEVVL